MTAHQLRAQGQRPVGVPGRDDGTVWLPNRMDGIVYCSRFGSRFTSVALWDTARSALLIAVLGAKGRFRLWS